MRILQGVGCAIFSASVILSISVVLTMSDPLDGFEVTDRGILDFGVPFVRSGPKYGNNRPTALDVGPRGNPNDEPNSGKAWIDVCNADLIDNPNAPVSCLYAGAWSDHMEFGTRSFNGAPVVPLKIRIGNIVIGELNSDGLVIYGKITAGEFASSGSAPPSPPPLGYEVYTGNGQHRNVPGPALGSGDFTYDFWLRTSQTTRVDLLTQGNSYTSPKWYGLLLNVGGAGQLQWYEGTTPKITATASYADNEWHHIAIVRSGNTVTLYLDGVSKGSYQTAYSFGDGTALRLGTPVYAGGGSYVGYIDDFRVSDEALWTAEFTPPQRTE